MAVKFVNVKSGYKLPPNYVFLTVASRDENDSKLSDCYESCLHKRLAFDINYIAFCSMATGVHGFDQRKAAKMALATIRHWLESDCSLLTMSFHAHMWTMKYGKILCASATFLRKSSIYLMII